MTNKIFIYKIFDNNGNFLGTWGDASFVSFRKTINGGLGELRINLARNFDDFDEGNTVALNNEVVVTVSDSDTPSEGTIIYDGYISSYTPWIDGEQEGVTIQCLGYVSKLATQLYKTGTTVEMVQNSVDPSAIIKDIVDKLAAEYSDNKITYTTSSVANTSTAVSYTFPSKMALEAIERTRWLAPTDWWWRIGADNVLYFKSKPTVATHEFVFGKDFNKIEVLKSMEEVRNNFLFWNGETDEDQIFKKYVDATSQSTYSARWERHTDSRVTDATTANAWGNTFIANNKNPSVRTMVVITDNNGEDGKGYDIETIQPGDTCKFLNLSPVTSSTFGGNMPIIAVEYYPTFAVVEIERAAPFSAGPRALSEIKRDLIDHVYGSGPTTYDADGRAKADVSVYLGTNQNITAATNTTVNLDTEIKDSGGDFNISTYTFTAPAARDYFIYAQITFGVNADLDRVRALIYKNTTTLLAQTQVHARNTGQLSTSVMQRVTLAAGDTIILQAQNADSNDTLIAGTGANAGTLTYMIIYEL